MPRKRWTIQGRVVYERKKHEIKPSDVRRFIKGRVVARIKWHNARGEKYKDSVYLAIQYILGQELSEIISSIFREEIGDAGFTATEAAALGQALATYYEADDSFVSDLLGIAISILGG